LQKKLRDYNRIAIIGCSGSGKSTLARQIAEQTGHPLIHLDYENWSPGWVSLPKEEFIAKQREWAQGERWLIDGNYNSSMEIRFLAADLVIFLDLPRWLCVWRVFKRQGTQRPDIKPGVVERGIFSKDFAAFLRFVLFYNWNNRPRVYELHEKYPAVAFLRLNTRKAVKDLLEQNHK